MSKKFKVEDIKPNSLVVLKKHNGRGRPITYRAIFIDSVHKFTGTQGENITSFTYDYYNGHMFF